MSEATPGAGSVADRVIRVIANTQKISAGGITIDSTFEELKIDSLDGINILFSLEGEFDVDIPDDEARELKSILAAVEGIGKLLAAKQAKAGAAAPAQP